MSDETLNMLLLLTPLIIGGIIALVNHDKTNDITENVESWFRKKHAKSRLKSNKLNNYIISPILWVIVKFSDWTDSFSHRGLKNGVRTTSVLYLIAACLFLLIFSFTFLIVLAFSIALLYFAFKVLINSENGSGQTYRTILNSSQKQQNTLENVGARGKKVYAGSNWFNEELKGRVDEDGNIYTGTNFFNEDKIGRIDEEGTIYKGSSFFNEEKVGRIDDKGSLYKGSNWFTEEKKGRVSEDGTIHKGSNWFNEEKKGRTGE